MKGRNLLAGEKSPYLRQHAGNPVDWHPWGPEAFARARDEDRPIFLSIGYSTCHWCHVMAHESFEDPATAALLNENFVPVKVDREERPDVDHVYMTYVQGLTGQGGWPLSAWLTPDLKPFHGGTYFPPRDAYGRPGFPSLLRAIARGWREDRARIVAEAERVAGALAAEAGAGAPPAAGGEKELAAAVAEGFEHLRRAFDPANGGFGGAPKFPRASNLAFLFRCAASWGPASEKGAAAVGMAVRTLRGMARGGIHDHVGGGFHRYAVDENWFVPHFEKMLYDQAQIAINAIEAWQASGDERQAWLARDILDYVLRDLAHPAGGFFSAEDADSPEPVAGRGREGAFYLWSRDEIQAVLGEDASLLCLHFGVTADGNVPPGRDPAGEFRGRNLLAAPRPLAETARQLGLTAEEASDRLASGLERLREARARRPRPARDEKIVTAWNGLMISALARAASLPAEALAGRPYLAAAVGAANFVRAELHDEERGALFRSWCGGRGPVEGLAEDYAFLIQGLLDLHEASFDPAWLQWAERLQDRMDRLFWDEAGGGYFDAASGAPDLLLRLKGDYDGAEPAASSVAASNLLRLDALLGGGRRERARRTLEAFRLRWGEAPAALPQMLAAADFFLAPPEHVVLAGDPERGDFRALAAVLSERLGPRRALVFLTGAARAWWSERAPWLASLPAADRAAAYVCRNFSCRAPVFAPEELREALPAADGPPRK